MPIANSLCLRCKQESGRCQGFRRDGVRRVLSRPLNAYEGGKLQLDQLLQAIAGQIRDQLSGAAAIE